MRECTLITESRVEECGIVAQVVKCAPRVCGDDPIDGIVSDIRAAVLPAYAGMIPFSLLLTCGGVTCSPRMRG